MPGYAGVCNHLQILAKNNDLAEYLDKFAGVRAALSRIDSNRLHFRASLSANQGDA